MTTRLRIVAMSGFPRSIVDIREMDIKRWSKARPIERIIKEMEARIIRDNPNVPGTITVEIVK